MKTLVRSILVAVLLAGLAGTVTTVAAQRVWVDVRIGTSGYHSRHYGYRHYNRGHRFYRQYHRPYVRHHRGAVIVVGPRGHSYYRPTVRRPLRPHRSHHYRYY